MPLRISPPSIDDLLAGARFLGALPPYLRQPLGLKEARAIVRRRQQERETRFLKLAERTIFGHRKSPYRRLLQLAGCEPGDLTSLVQQDGLEGALRLLFRRGVYLTVDELKGRRTIRRGSSEFSLSPASLRNPLASYHLARQSSGSQGTRVAAPFDLEFVRDLAADWRLMAEAVGSGTQPKAQWYLPGGFALRVMLESAFAGVPNERWFSQVDPGAPGLHPRYVWSARVLRWGGWLAGVHVPPHQYVPTEAPQPLVRWLADHVRAGRRPLLRTFVSGAVRLCEVASSTGLDIRGARFQVGGEPLTPARQQAIEAAGVETIAGYGAAESGRIGHGCLAREGSDDHHLIHDRLSVIQPGLEAGQADLPSQAVLITSLLPHAPLILLNASLGDQAELMQRSCGCPLEHEGWPWHIRTVRSFKKLNAGGMTFLDGEVERVLEEVLPARFGGGPLDFQLLEEQAPGGQPRLRLLIDPRLGPLDEDGVSDVFLAALGTGSGAEQVMALYWRQAGFLTVERQRPDATSAGKVLHLIDGASLAGPAP